MSTKVGVSVEPSSRVARSEDIIFTELDETVVMMDVKEGCYYELDPIGTKIWALVESGPRVAEVCEALAAEYEVAPDACGDEVRAFLEELSRREVVRILPGNGVNETASDGTRAPMAPSISGNAAAARLQEAGAKLGWMTPAIRVMPVARVADGKSAPQAYFINEVPGGTGTYQYSNES